jgi:hypothetical protein
MNLHELVTRFAWSVLGMAGRRLGMRAALSGGETILYNVTSSCVIWMTLLDMRPRPETWGRSRASNDILVDDGRNVGTLNISAGLHVFLRQYRS